MTRPAIRLAIGSLLLALASPAVRAQPYDTPLLALGAGHPYAPVQLYSVDATGNSVVRHVFWTLSVVPSSFTAHHDNRTLVMDSTNPDAVALFDLPAGSFQGVLHQGLPLGDVFMVRPFDTGDYLVADAVYGTTSPNASVKLLRADGSGVQTLFGQQWDAQIRSLAQDLVTGQILAGVLHIGPGTAPSLIRIDPDAGTFVTLDPTPRNVTALVQDHRDGAIIYGEYNGGIFRYAPDGTISTLVPANNAHGIRASSLAFDRASGNGILLAGGAHRIARIAFEPGAAATVLAVHEASLPQGLPAVKDLAFERGRNVITRRTGAQRWAIELSFPGEAGRPYVLALSSSGFAPGISLGQRTVPLVPDGALAASLSGGLAPFLQDNVGVLDAEGNATATLDLSVFGPLPGIRVWLAAVTLDGLAPHGLHTISKPSILVLR